MERDLVTFAFIESIFSMVPRLLGGIAFTRPEYIGASRVHRAGPRRPAQFAECRHAGSASEWEPVPLAEGSRGGECARRASLPESVRNIDLIDLANPALADFYRTSHAGHRFFHFSYSFRAMCVEVWPPRHIYELQQMRIQIDRQVSLTAGRTATLLRLTREGALANPYAHFSG